MQHLSPGGTHLSFWYSCAAQRAANGGLKSGQARKIGALRTDFWGTDFWEKIGTEKN